VRVQRDHVTANASRPFVTAGTVTRLSCTFLRAALPAGLKKLAASLLALVSYCTDDVFSVHLNVYVMTIASFAFVFIIKITFIVCLRSKHWAKKYFCPARATGKLTFGKRKPAKVTQKTS